jgi:hypothetical protein
VGASMQTQLWRFEPQRTLTLIKRPLIHVRWPPLCWALPTRVRGTSGGGATMQKCTLSVQAQVPPSTSYLRSAFSHDGVFRQVHTRWLRTGKGTWAAHRFPEHPLTQAAHLPSEGCSVNALARHVIYFFAPVQYRGSRQLKVQPTKRTWAWAWACMGLGWCINQNTSFFCFYRVLLLQLDPSSLDCF